MPAKSKSQQRLFGMVHAYQKGELKDASKEVKDIAGDISKKDAEKFAETKHKGLPNRVKKNKGKKVRKMDENTLKQIIKESVKKALNEMEYGYDVPDIPDDVREWGEKAQRLGLELSRLCGKYLNKLAFIFVFHLMKS